MITKIKFFAGLMVLLFLLQMLTVLSIPFFPDVEEAEAQPTGAQECADIVDNGDGTYTHTSATCRVWDGDSWEKWYLSQGFGAGDETYRIANSRVGYELHKTTGNITYYNPYFNDTRVSMEHWTVEVAGAGGAWHDTLVHADTPTVSYHSNSTGLYLTMVKERNDVRLELVHVIEYGKAMKHTLNIKSTNSTAYEYRLIQNWNDIQDASSVKYGFGTSTTFSNGNSVNVSKATGYEFSFLDSSGDIIAYESQLEALNAFKSVTLGKANDKVYATYYFQNVTSQTLSSGQHFTIDPTTDTIQKGLGGSFIGGESGGTCSALNGGHGGWLYSSQMGNEVSWGPEDGSRCYVAMFEYDLSGIPDTATVTDTTYNFGDLTCYSGSSNCMNAYTDDSTDDTTIGFIDNDTCHSNNDGDSTLYSNAITPEVWLTADADDWDNSDVDLGTKADADIMLQLTAGTKYSGSDTDRVCLVLMEKAPLSYITSSSHGFFVMEGVGDTSGTYGQLSVTYSTTTYYEQIINIRTADGTNVNEIHNDPEIQLAHTNGTTTSFQNCVKDDGTIATCHFLTRSDEDDETELWIRLGTVNVQILDGDGGPSHNITTSASATHDLEISLYKDVEVEFHDAGLAAINAVTPLTAQIPNATPQNFTINFANGTAINSASMSSDEFDVSKGVKNIGWVTNGTNTMEAVYRLGANRIDNGSATFVVTADAPDFSFKQKVWLTDFDFTSSNRALQAITPSAISLSVTGNGSVGDKFTFSGGGLVSGAQKFQFGNDTIAMTAIRFQGTNMIENSTGVVISQNAKFSWTMRYYPMTWLFQADGSSPAFPIVPAGFTFEGVNGTKLELDGTSDTPYISYSGNGTINPEGVTAFGQGMIGSSQANIVLTSTESNTLDLQYYRTTFAFQSVDTELTLVPSQFTFEAPNSTKRVVTDFTKYYYMGNGTLNPEGVTYLGQGMIGAAQADLTISAAATHTLSLQYYEITFAFQSADGELTIVPSGFTFEAPNATKTEITDWSPHARGAGHYIGNGTLNPEGITYLGQGMIGGSQANIAISAAATHTLSLQYYETTFIFKSSDDALTIVPEAFTFEASNGTKREITDWSPQARAAGYYIGNGTINPEGVTYHGQGMIGSSQANLAISAESTKTLTLQYYKQTLVFESIDGVLTITPTNFQVVLSNSTEKTINNTLAAFPAHVYVGNGTATPRGITYQGAGVINVQTPWAVDADETITQQVQLYKKIFTFESDDLLLTITPSAFQYTAPNGTQIVQTSHFNGHVREGVYLGNGTLTPQGITYQGSGMIKNVTAITISIDSDAGTGGNQNEHLWRLRYYAIPLGFTSSDLGVDAVNIIPAGFTFEGVNSSKLEITDFTKTLYLGNGTVTPEGITYLGQGMINNNTAITISSSEVMGGGFRLQFFRLNFDFASADSLLTPTPSQITYQAPNGTQIVQTTNYDVHYVGNGTLTPQGITFQSTGMIKNVTAITIDASETHLLRMNYYKQDFEFRNTLSSSIITPTNFIMTLANGTQVTLTSFTGYYFGNQTVASVDTITVGGLDTKKNATGFAISTDDDAWLLWSLECCTVTFVFSSVDDVLQGITPTTFEFDMGNGTYVIITNVDGSQFSNVQFTDSDTVTPRAVRFQGTNMILNSTAFTIDDSSGLSQTFKINIQYYRINWDFASVDSELDLFTTLTNWQYLAPNGTAITQTVDLVGSYVGNGTLTPITLKYKGQGILVNNTGIAIDSDETHLIRGQWYSVGFIFMSNDHLLDITPDHIQFMAPNGTVIVFTNDAHFAGHYVGNGTITPQGITYLGQGMIKNQTGITITQAGNHLFNMQYYRVTINFVSNDGELALTPTNFKAVVANSTTPFTATHTTLYLGNGTLTPHVITWQSQNIVSNSTAITIDSDETWLIRGRYYAITFDFLSDAGTRLSLGDAPDNFIFTLGNGTEVTITDDKVLDGDSGILPGGPCSASSECIYVANQTLTPFSILWDGTSVHKNQTQFSISDDANIAMRTKVYTINFVFRSVDDVLTITPDNFIIVLSNTTEVTTTIPNRVSGWLLANGTLTPNKIGFQGTNMILNATAVTLDSSETHLLYMQYYPVAFEFKSDDLLLDIIPENMTFTGANNTISTATSFSGSVYLGNQTTLVINQVNYQGTNMIKNTSSITISGASNNLFRLQYLPVKAQVHGFNGVQSSALIEQIYVFNVNGTNNLILTIANGSRTWYSGNGTLQIAPAWNDIRVGLNYSTVHSSSNFFDIDGSGDANSTIITMPSRIFELKLPPCTTIICTGGVVGWFAIEDTDVSCQETTRTNSTCIIFGEGRLRFETTGTSGPKTLVLQLLSHDDCTVDDAGFVSGTCLTQPNAVLVNTTNYEFPEQDWIWDGTNKLFKFSMPMSTTNTTISLFANATWGASEFLLGIENTNTCLKAGDLICVVTTPYTRSGSLGLWFYGIMMMMPVGMVWLRTTSIGPTFIVMVVLIWIFGIFAPSFMGTSILPPEMVTFSYLFVILSVAATLYRLLKRD